MRGARFWQSVLIVLAAGLLTGGVARVSASDPPPAYVVDLPLVTVIFPPQPPSTGFFGMNGGSIDGHNTTSPYPGDLAYYPALRSKSFHWMDFAGLHWYRNYGSDGIVYSWQFVEPQADHYDWTAWDLLVREAQAHHISLLASIGNAVPGWANGNKDKIEKPTDLYTLPMENTSWYKYVRTFVERYDGDGVDDMPGLYQPVKYWEFWNEADLRWGFSPPTYPPHQFDGTVADYVQLRKVAYAATKAADPTAVVVGPTTAQFAGNTALVGTWFIWDWNQFINAGGLDTLDIVSFTHYFDPGNWDENNEVQNLLAVVNNNRFGKPVWFTETGWYADATDERDKVNSLLRSNVILWSTPWIGKYFWYDFQEPDDYPPQLYRGLLRTKDGGAAQGSEPDPVFSSAYRAVEVMSRVLGAYDSNYHPTEVEVGPTARAYHFAANGQEVWVIWLRAISGTGHITLDTGGRATRVIGLYGQDFGTFPGGSIEVDPDPVYLTTDLNWSPDIGRITGRLRNAAQLHSWTNGVAGATVAISGPVSATTTTDSDGNYVFSNLPLDTGTYHVTVPNLPASPPSYDLDITRLGDWGRTSFTVTVTAVGQP